MLLLLIDVVVAILMFVFEKGKRERENPMYTETTMRGYSKWSLLRERMREDSVCADAGMCVHSGQATAQNMWDMQPTLNLTGPESSELTVTHFFCAATTIEPR